MEFIKFYEVLRKTSRMLLSEANQKPKDPQFSQRHTRGLLAGCRMKQAVIDGDVHRQFIQI